VAALIITTECVLRCRSSIDYSHVDVPDAHWDGNAPNRHWTKHTQATAISTSLINTQQS